jgi:hypothetical protein
MAWAPLFAQVKFSVSTDKTVYQYGDSIHITITAVNMGSTIDTLVFPSTCQVNYYIDSFNLLQHRACGQIITYAVIPSHDSVAWREPYLPPYPVTRDTLAIGNHAVVGEVIRYWISDTAWIKVNSEAEVRESENNLRDYFLGDNYPNPFNPSTTIQYGLPSRSSVRLVIYNVLGQVVKELVNTEQQAGIQSAVWNANFSSGMYFYRIEATSKDDPSKRFIETKKMLLLK